MERTWEQITEGTRRANLVLFGTIKPATWWDRLLYRSVVLRAFVRWIPDTPGLLDQYELGGPIHIPLVKGLK